MEPLHYYCVALIGLLWCGMVWLYGDCCCEEVRGSENNAGHAIVGAPYRSSATTLRNQLSWQSLKKNKKNRNYVLQPGCIDVSDQVLPLLIYMTYFSLSTNSINIILGWVIMVFLSLEHVQTWCLGDFAIQVLFCGIPFQTILKVLTVRVPVTCIKIVL